MTTEALQLGVAWERPLCGFFRKRAKKPRRACSAVAFLRTCTHAARTRINIIRMYSQRTNNKRTIKRTYLPPVVVAVDQENKTLHAFYLARIVNTRKIDGKCMPCFLEWDSRIVVNPGGSTEKPSPKR